MSGPGTRRRVGILEADVALRALLAALVEGAGYTAVPLDAAGRAGSLRPAALAALVVDLDAPVLPPPGELAAPALLLSSREGPAAWPGGAAEVLPLPLVAAEFLAALRRAAGPP